MAQTISLHELLDRIATESVVVVEALSRDFYSGGHLPASVNLPFSSSDSAIAAFVEAARRPIVVYGSRGGGEASELALRIEAAGARDVSVLRGGKESWVEAGRPLERGPLP